LLARSHPLSFERGLPASGVKAKARNILNIHGIFITMESIKFQKKIKKRKKLL